MHHKIDTFVPIGKSTVNAAGGRERERAGEVEDGVTPNIKYITLLKRNDPTPSE